VTLNFSKNSAHEITTTLLVETALFLMEWRRCHCGRRG